MRTQDDLQLPLFSAGRGTGSETGEDRFVGRAAKVFAGTHLIVDFMDAEGLDCPARIEATFRAAVAAAGATILHIHMHKFSPQGVSGVAVLAESHLSVHTWPEIGYGAFDIFMCGDSDPHAALEVLRAEFRPSRIHVSQFLRGEGVAP